MWPTSYDTPCFVAILTQRHRGTEGAEVFSPWPTFRRERPYGKRRSFPEKGRNCTYYAIQLPFSGNDLLFPYGRLRRNVGHGLNTSALSVPLCLCVKIVPKSYSQQPDSISLFKEENQVFHNVDRFAELRVIFGKKFNFLRVDFLFAELRDKILIESILRDPGFWIFL